ncbi:MAG: hypothetical protein FWG30_02685 [Eubacteriaceae bacterium]|nr:hypothetical protein [Eubacteriaceae bacterium]
MGVSMFAEIKAYYQFIRTQKLTYPAREVWRALLELWNESQWADVFIASAASIADKAQIPVVTAKRALKELDELGLLKNTNAGSRKTSAIQMQSLAEMHNTGSLTELMDPQQCLRVQQEAKPETAQEQLGLSGHEPGVLISLPLKGGGEFRIDLKWASELQDAYLELDVPKELKRMQLWCDSHPDRLKTQKGIKAFVTSWLARSQEPRKESSNAEYKGYEHRKSSPELPGWDSDYADFV